MPLAPVDWAVIVGVGPERAGVAPGAGFPMVVRDLAPAGVRGLVLVSFFAAFMSTAGSAGPSSPPSSLPEWSA